MTDSLNHIKTSHSFKYSFHSKLYILNPPPQQGISSKQAFIQQNMVLYVACIYQTFVERESGISSKDVTFSISIYWEMLAHCMAKELYLKGHAAPLAAGQFHKRFLSPSPLSKFIYKHDDQVCILRIPASVIWMGKPRYRPFSPFYTYIGNGPFYI